MRTLDDEPVIRFFQHYANLLQCRGHGGEAVAFLDAQFFQAAGRGGAFGHCGRDKEDRKFVDHTRRDGGIDLDPPEVRVPHMQIGDRLPADFAFVQLFDIGTHQLERAENAIAGRIEADILDHEVAARYHAGRHGEESGGGRVARYGDVAGAQLGGTVNADGPLAIGLLDCQFGAEPAQHALGMIARRHRLDHRSRARCVQAGKQYRAFHLRAGHRQAVGDRYGGLHALHRQRQRAAGGGGKACAHGRKRVDNSVHRAFRQAGIASEGRGDSVACDHAHEEPCRSTRIAHVERPVGLQ